MKGKQKMKFAVNKILDKDGNVQGYKTTGLKPELLIKMFIEEETAENIFKKISSIKNISETVSGIANVDVRCVKTEDGICIVLPDSNGLFPEDDGCEEIFKNQL